MFLVHDLNDFCSNLSLHGFKINSQLLLSPSLSNSKHIWSPRPKRHLSSLGRLCKFFLGGFFYQPLLRWQNFDFAKTRFILNLLFGVHESLHKAIFVIRA